MNAQSRSTKDSIYSKRWFRRNTKEVYDIATDLNLEPRSTEQFI